jgi:DNA helicase IV
VAQNVTPWRGVGDWTKTFPDFTYYTLNQNYRNTNQIVEYVSKTLNLDMQSIAFDGEEVVKITTRGLSGFFKNKKGLRAIICTEAKKAELMRKSYNDLGQKGKVSRSKINIMSVYESKGLEFSSVAVVTDGMSDAEKYIAFTRALKELAVIENKK